jgi:hypothetical protein
MPRAVRLVTRVLLLDDRGWSQTPAGAGAGTVAEVVRTARMVVGPDEPFDGRSQDDMETDHWNALARTLHAHGVVVEAGELKRLPHDVVLSERLSALTADRIPDR